jgi:hypothetical protein
MLPPANSSNVEIGSEPDGEAEDECGPGIGSPEGAGVGLGAD